MEKLRVLHIQSSNIELPPESFQSSMSLRTLNLHNCDLYGELSALLESLVKVEVLSLYDSSYMGEWPKEIAKLKSLKSLDLRFGKSTGEGLPTGILMHLLKLEELYLGPELASTEILMEIVSLPNLNTIEFVRSDFDVLRALVENLNVEKLLRFCIWVGFKGVSPYHFSRTMVVLHTEIECLLEPKIKALLSKVDEHLALYRVTGDPNDFEGLRLSSHLKSLELRNCEMKYICNTMNLHPREGIFVELKRLCIEQAEQLEELCHGNIPPRSFVELEELTLENVPLLSCLFGPLKPPCFENLKTLKIKDGKMLRSLVFGSPGKCFPQLQVIQIQSCPKLETFVSCPKPEFPELEVVYLEDVDSFKALYSEPEASTILPCSSNSSTSVFPKLRDLTICQSKSLHAVDVTKNVQNLTTLNMSHCSVEVCFDFEGWREEITGEIGKRVFHNLDSLILSDLRNLRHLCRNLPERMAAFQNLTILSISDCENLKYLLTPSMAKMFASLKELEIKRCWQMESIIGSEEADEVATIELVHGEDEILLPELCKLKLSELPVFRMICSQSIHLSFPSWNDFSFYDCPRMNKFCAGTLIAPKLNQAKCEYYFNGCLYTRGIDMKTMREWLKDSELGKCCINCDVYGETMCDHLREGSSSSKDNEDGINSNI